MHRQDAGAALRQRQRARVPAERAPRRAFCTKCRYARESRDPGATRRHASWVQGLAEFTLGPREARTRGSPGTREQSPTRGRASARLHIPHAIRYSAHAGCRREDEHALPVARDPQSHYPDQAAGAKPWCSDRSATNLKPIVRSEQLRPNRTFTMRRLARGGVRGLRQPPCCSGCPERSCPHPRRTNQSRHWYAPIPTSSQVMTKRT